MRKLSTLLFLIIFILSFPVSSVFGAKPQMYTFCHAAGRQGTEKFVTLTLPYAGFSKHMEDNGTPKAGHELDYIGRCEGDETPVDVCPNIDGDQAEIPNGYHFEEVEGDFLCIIDETPAPSSSPNPVDVCANIDGVQTGVPDGLHLDASGKNCVAFSQSNPPEVPYTPGKVLGAETTRLADTGTAEENTYLMIALAGILMTGIGVKKLTNFFKGNNI